MPINRNMELEISRANDLHIKIMELKNRMIFTFLDLGMTFREINENKYYKSLGFKTFGEYIKSPDVKFERSTVYGMIAVYEKYILNLEIPKDRIIKIGWKRLFQLTAHINNENKNELLKKAEELDRKDFENQIQKYYKKRSTSNREFGEKIDFEGCQHAPVNEMGVVFLFGILSKRLGFNVDYITSRFPDCTAKMQLPNKREKLVRIEFEL